MSRRSPSLDPDTLACISEIERILHGPAILVAADGSRIEIPETLRAAFAEEAHHHVCEEEWLGTQEAADRYGVSRLAIIALLEGGRLTSRHKGAQRQIPVRDLDAHFAPQAERQMSIGVS